MEVPLTVLLLQVQPISLAPLVSRYASHAPMMQILKEPVIKSVIDAMVTIIVNALEKILTSARDV